MVIYAVYGYAWDWKNEKYVDAKFRFDGDVYNVVPGTEHTTFNVDAGSYKIEMIIPDYTFDSWDSWVPDLPHPIFVDKTANPTTVHILSDCYFFVWVHPTPDPFETEFVETYRGVDIYQYVLSGWYTFTYREMVYALPPPLSDVHTYIDDLIAEAEVPEFIEEYRGYEIWRRPDDGLYYSNVTPYLTLIGTTLAEIRVVIDDYITSLEDPDPDPGSILEQLMTWVMGWVQFNLPGWLAPVYDAAETALGFARVAWEGLVSDAVALINGVSAALTVLTTDVGDRWDNFTTVTLPGIWAGMETAVADFNAALDTAVDNITAARNDAIAEVFAWVPTFLYGLIDGAFIADHPKYIADSMDPVIAQLIEGAVTSFWMGFEEGYAAG